MSKLTCRLRLDPQGLAAADALTELHEEQRRMLELLFSDAYRFLPAQNPSDRRHFVRAAIASVEGIAFGLKRLALQKQLTRRDALFLPGELALLAEQS